VCLIWGTTYLGIRIALETIPPALVGAIRYTIAGGALAVVLRINGENLPPVRYWPGLAVAGALMIGFGNGGVIWAEQWVPSGVAAIMVASTPFWMTGLEAVLPGGERLSRRVVIGLIIGFGGILLLVWPDVVAGGAAGRAFAAGVVSLQIACAGWALGSSYSRRHAREENALGAAALQMVFGGLLMCAVATVRGEWTMLAFTRRTLAAEMYLTLAGSLAGYPAYVYALKYLPVSTVGTYAYINPVIAMLVGAFIGGEELNSRIAIASAIVFTGVALARHGTTITTSTKDTKTSP
jgi:drug/metabolite transporter (DMT)-like permease